MKTDAIKKRNTIAYDKLFDILKIKVHPKKKAWKIYIKPKKLIHTNETNEIESAFKTLYSLKDVRLIIETITDETFRNSWPQILKSLYKENPGFKGFLNGSSASYQNDCVTITLPTQNSFVFLTDKNFSNIFIDMMIKNYNIKVKLKLLYDDKEEENQEYIENLLIEEKQIVSDALKDCNDKNKSNKHNDNIILGKYISDEKIMPIETINSESGMVTVEGTVFFSEIKELNNGSKIVNFYLTDYNDSLNCKLFIKADKNPLKIAEQIREGIRIRLKGNVQFDTYINDVVLYPNSIIEIPKKIRIDTSEDKRIELHTHTNMSSMDGITPAASLIKRAKEWVHKVNCWLLEI